MIGLIKPLWKVYYTYILGNNLMLSRCC